MTFELDSVIFLNKAKIIHRNCRHYMRVFSVAKGQQGIIKGIDLDGNVRKERIKKMEIVPINIADDDQPIEMDYYMVFHGVDGNSYLIAHPHHNYSMYFLEMRGILVLVFMINCNLESKAYTNKHGHDKLDSVLGHCSESMFMRFSIYEKKEFLEMMEKAIGNHFSKYELVFIDYMKSINAKKTILPRHDDCTGEKPLTVPIGKYITKNEYPWIEVDHMNRLFVPYDKNDPPFGTFTSYIDVKGKSKQEIQQLKLDIMSPYLDTTIQENPLYTLSGPAVFKRKKSKMQIVL